MPIRCQPVKTGLLPVDDGYVTLTAYPAYILGHGS
jgi:hypothetical protein